jgi:hypothetical protein
LTASPRLVSFRLSHTPSDVNGQEIPFFDKRDKIVRISTFFQSTLAVTERGKVYAVGEKVAKTAKIETNKFGFFEVPLGDIAPESNSDKKDPSPSAQEKSEEPKASEPPADVESALHSLASMFGEGEEAPKPEEVKQPSDAPSGDSSKMEKVPDALSEVPPA